MYTYTLIVYKINYKTNLKDIKNMLSLKIKKREEGVVAIAY